ncbi:MAG: hypothetical protein J6S45_05715 [Firmicutes bacterium]|nr:hypothetical protein [Bacillota bacterium]
MKKTRVFLIVTLIAMILTMTLAIGFGAGTPGSEDDPIVTKSYVDQVVEALKEEMKKIQPETQAPSSTGWQVVQVPAKTTVIGETGTEMILRSGYASAVDNGKNGISDLTSGQDLRMGTNITLNHLLLIPGSDGRGIKTDGMCFVMINGGYTMVTDGAQ